MGRAAERWRAGRVERDGPLRLRVDDGMGEHALVGALDAEDCARQGGAVRARVCCVLWRSVWLSFMITCWCYEKAIRQEETVQEFEF